MKKNNEDIALRILYVPNEEEENEIIDVQPEYISKFNFTKKKQEVLLKISDGSGKLHFLALKSELEENSDCMKPTKSFSKLPENNKKIKQQNYGSKALRINDIIYVDLECLLVNYDTCSNDPNKSHTRNIAQHIPSG